MENKNIIIAVTLSMLILLGWSYFIDAPQQAKKKVELQNQKISSPTLQAQSQSKIVSRSEAIKGESRINIENNNLIGSISLKGALIDDITLKNYREDISKDSKEIVLLNPKKTLEGYFVESGWATKGDVRVPDNNSVWQVREGRKLTPNTPVTLQWNNGEGVTFIKKIEVDDKYLFKITETVRNDKAKAIELYSYSQITKNQEPTTKKFYILHEGFITVLNKNLKEEDFSDIKKETKNYNGNSGWVGITDKYWMAAAVPEFGKSFKVEFSYKDTYKANYVATDATVISPQKSASSNIKIFAGAKDVKTIDDYAEKEKIDRFDLSIDWGWFYFITKPLFFVMDYIYKVVGNFGIAIIVITFLVRIIFFPLANYSYRSMAKMKVLQPEMLRIKELYKDDARKTQQEIMSLYKRENVNPLSGCLPILIQIPIFFAVYKMLFVTLEMRQAPFFGWIKDLSAADPTTIFNLFGLIPWSPPSFLMIGVWPILMGVTMWFQQKLNPAPIDPIQAKIFQFFPIMLTVMLASFPSGLVVYWTISNVLTIGQQWFIMRQTKTKTV